MQLTSTIWHESTSVSRAPRVQDVRQERSGGLIRISIAALRETYQTTKKEMMLHDEVKMGQNFAQIHK